MNFLRLIFFSRIFLCLLSGALLGISQPLYFSDGVNNLGGVFAYSGLICLLAFVPALIKLRNCSIYATFFLTMLLGTANFTISYCWIYDAIFIYSSASKATAFMLTLGLPLIIAFFWGVAFSLAQFIRLNTNTSFLLWFPIALCSVEFFRNYFLFGGFPWANVGYAFARVPQFLQSASFIGVYGLVFIVGVINALFTYGVLHKPVRRVAYSGGVGILALLYLYGSMRINSYQPSSFKAINVSAIQGNIEQGIKNKAYIYSDEIIEIYKDLSKQAVADGAQLILWPESAYPRSLPEEINYFALAKELQTPLILGTTLFGFNGPQKESYHYSNSALIVDKTGKVVSTYHKHHLVPFGEYVPWPLKSVVHKIVPGLGAFKIRAPQGVLSLPFSPTKTYKIGVSICYEGIFPEIARKYANEEADFLVNLTNDAWYGFSSAPFQHLHMYRLRAVETGLTILRSTNTGVTAWVDPLGQTHAETKIFTRLINNFQVPLSKVKTVYAKVGDVIPWLCSLLMLVSWLYILLPLKAYLNAKKYISIFLSFLSILGFLLFYGFLWKTHCHVDESYGTKLVMGGLLWAFTLYVIYRLSKTSTLKSHGKR